jgi:hypothetical protein
MIGVQHRYAWPVRRSDVQLASAKKNDRTLYGPKNDT